MQFNIFDLIAAISVLLGLQLIPKKKGWLIYILGCSIWTCLMFMAKYYFGMIMNVIAIIIALKRYSALHIEKEFPSNSPTPSVSPMASPSEKEEE